MNTKIYFDWPILQKQSCFKWPTGSFGHEGSFGYNKPPPVDVLAIFEKLFNLLVQTYNRPKLLSHIKIAYLTTGIEGIDYM